MLGKLRDELRVRRSSNPDQSKRQGRLATIEQCSGTFIVQIRGGFNDCPVPSLHVDPKKYKVSMDWKTLFGQFFNDKKLAKAALQAVDEDLDKIISHKNGKLAMYRDNETIAEVDDGNQDMLSGVRPDLGELARSDRDKWESFDKLTHGFLRQQIQPLRDPLGAWTRVLARKLGGARSSLANCRLRQRADKEVDIDEQGMIKAARIDWEFDNYYIADIQRRSAWIEMTSVSSRRCLSCFEEFSH